MDIFKRVDEILNTKVDSKFNRINEIFNNVGSPTTPKSDIKKEKEFEEIFGKYISEPTPKNIDINVNEEIKNVVKEASRKYGVDEALILAIIKQESGFNPHAVSPAGAQGLMQLMPETARDLGVSNPFDIKQNIMGGTKYIRQMLDMFNGDIKLALAAYNAGPGNVQKYGGIPPFSETQNYVSKVLSYYINFKNNIA